MSVEEERGTDGGVERRRGRVGQTSEESIGREETKTNAGVHGGLGVVEIIREPGEVDGRVTVDSPVLPVREAGAVETVVFERFIPRGRRVLPGDRLVVEIWPVR